ncbi:HAMP domain-containing sensor histidine kinase [Microbacterium betulae]|uniref:histidine kinase n=1 Tax=Microbacterium betulae TaxID=2981139 RepID=A0AA97FEQ1_9MICO|nr:HAMP domain-containing sensor histidine kinase [Microbacterium sp. AB]WOF21773.1 HAMP domain-containing sensor histidine kinase [Microbacterium sp. AB]
MALVRRRRTPVRVRILAAILLVTALGLIVAGGSAFLLQRTRVIVAIDDELRQEYTSVQALITGTGPDASQEGAGESEQAPVATPSFADTEQLVYEVVRVIPPPLDGGTLGIVDGEARYRPGVATYLDLDEVAFTADVMATGGGTEIGTATLGGETVRYLAITLSTEESASAGLFVSAIAVDARLADLESVMALYAWVASGVVVVVALVGWFVAGRLLQPVRELRTTAARITAGALDERIPVTGNDDLSELTETINAMIARLEEAFRSQRRIVNDVRHELATPVTIVRGHLELVDADDPADVEQTRALVIDELDRMSDLIAQIAHLAEAERAAAHRPQRVDVGGLTRHVFEKVRVIPGREWALGSVAAGEAVLDPTRVTQAWLQLADNAAKHSAPGDRIEIGSAVRSDEVSLWVADEGPGIPEAARARIFERFGRAEASRGVAGSGLGLAIVQALVRAHGGHVDLDTEVGRGSTFTMVLPRDGVPAGDERAHDGATEERGS